jgi:tetratricopeptide (TPR) repeat protein
MVCPSCGASNSEGRLSCTQCGRGLTNTDDSATVAFDGPAAAPYAPPRPAAAAAGVATPPPESGPAMTWGTIFSQPGAVGPSNFAPGSAFGRYRIEAMLGEGGMGAVFRAYDTELGRTVALKLVRPELATNPQTMQRFKQELLLASKISHKNILRIHDLGDFQGVKFITMAFVEGMDLAGLLERTGRLDLDRALKFTRQLCAALEAAHHEGVVHRDLKPQNILIDRADNLFVSDFGLAKSLEAEYSMGTRTGQILGTPRYMSPEQVEAREVDHRSDIYSFGLIVYEMLTGELPFRGDSAMQLMYQRVTERPKDPRQAVKDLPAYLANIVLKCLEKDPAQRYQSAREILDDLDARNAPAPASRPQSGAQSISIQIPKPSRRGTILTAGAMACVAAILAVVPTTRHAIRGLLPGAPKAEQAGIQYYIGVPALNVAGDDSLKYIADGIGDSLRAKLSALRNVYVADTRTMAVAKLLVKGTLQGAGDRIALTLRIENADGKPPRLIPEIKGVKQDLLTLEDRVFTQIADALVIRQSSEEKARTTAHPTEDLTAYDLYLRGNNIIHGKRTAAAAQEALSLFEQATNKDPSFALAYAGTADACIRMYQETRESSWTQKAIGAAEQAQRLNDNMPQVHDALGTAYGAVGRTAEAISELKRSLQLAPNSDDCLRRLGSRYADAGQHDQAAAAFAEAVRINPYYWNNYAALGAAYYRLGQNEKALAAYRNVVRLNPGEPRGWGGEGMAYYKMGDWNASIPAFEKAVAKDPSFNGNLGVAYFFLGKYDEAAKAFSAAVADSPEDTQFAESLADTYRWSNQPQKASAAYDTAIEVAFKALETNPKNTDALATLAGCFAKKGDDRKALEFIRRARQIDPKYSDLIYREATVHALAKRWPEAVASLKEALRNGSSLRELQADPEFKELRERPEFAALLKK